MADDDHRVGRGVEELARERLVRSLTLRQSCMRQPHDRSRARRSVLDPDAPAVGLDRELAEREPEAAPCAGTARSAGPST